MRLKKEQGLTALVKEMYEVGLVCLLSVVGLHPLAAKESVQMNRQHVGVSLCE
ncbi:MAG: hypothetical protein UX10_C0027G0004 [Candidatus Magasanikbacteria bacterium GW2011_GWA2_45_39]|uniref:Uncharacterized protein n=1 Tax=Candidatus Magasanikbacteria bacterium GW2011_GWA2_45_39 TaxID=1619041 RepID=A0A0G1QDD1_9BACT|nr:MAG: hypothetical protein UX10_C0027G0004 [Candidatus Magasanikbacteria bacterium GW2011_GWA2_45_39]